MKLFLRLPLAAVGLIAALATAAYLVPLSSYLPRIEQEAAQRLGQPVAIEDLRLLLLPRPQVRVSGIAVGKAGEVTISGIDVVPQLRSLLRPVKVIERIDIEGLSAPAGALGTLMPKQDDKADGAAGMRVRRIALRRAQLRLPDAALPVFDAEVALAESGAPERAALKSADGRLRIEATSEGAKLRIALAAQDWTLPLGAPIRFDELTGNAELQGTRLLIRSLAGRLYQGALDGNAELEWGKGWRLGGNLALQGVALEPLIALFSPDKTLGGRLDTRARFASSARDAGRIGDNLRIDGRFVIRDGVLYDLDLARAATLVGGSQSSSGNTGFDEFTGNYHTLGKSYRLRKLDVSSGLLKANGDVDISPSRQLAGKVYVELKTGVSVVQVPLRVTGTTQSPSLYPTGIALAGAAAGTATLGPGAGTGIGARLADALDSLFGGK